MSLKLRINEDMKAAMRAKDTARLGAVRLLLAAMKQKEVDERVELDDGAIVGIIDKMLKQRKDSIAQYAGAGRQDLVDAEKFEVDVLSAYMPQPLSAAEVEAIVLKAIADGGVSGPAAMGKIVGLVKPQVAGRADMGEVSKLIKAKLTSA